MGLKWGHRSKFLEKGAFSPREKKAATGKMKALSNQRGTLQVALAELDRNKIVTVNALLRSKNVRPLDRLILDSLKLTKNYQRAIDRRGARHDINPLNEGFITTEMNIAMKVISNARKKGLI